MKLKAAMVVSGVKRPLLRSQGLEIKRRMASYRLYGLDGVSMVASGEWIEAGDDQEAIEAARKKFDGGHCEIWQGPRLVARLERQDRH